MDPAHDIRARSIFVPFVHLGSLFFAKSTPLRPKFSRLSPILKYPPHSQGRRSRLTRSRGQTTIRTVMTHHWAPQGCCKIVAVQAVQAVQRDRSVGALVRCVTVPDKAHPQSQSRVNKAPSETGWCATQQRAILIKIVCRRVARVQRKGPMKQMNLVLTFCINLTRA